MSAAVKSPAGQGTTLAAANASIRRQKLRRYAIAYGVLILLALFFLFPIAFMIVGSFKADTSVIADSGSLRAFLPAPFVGLDNYASAIERADFWTSFRNSVIISGDVHATFVTDHGGGIYEFTPPAISSSTLQSIYERAVGTL